MLTVRPDHRRRRHRRLGAGAVMARAGKSVLLLERSDGLRGPRARRMDRALGRRRDPAPGPLRPADGRPAATTSPATSPMTRPSSRRRRKPIPCRWASSPRTCRARSASATRCTARPCSTRRSRPAPTSVRGVAVTDIEAGAAPRVVFEQGGEEIEARAPPAGRRRRPHLPGARGDRHHPAPGQAAPLVRRPADRGRRRLGRPTCRRSAPRATSPSSPSRRATAGCASMAATRSIRRIASRAPDGARRFLDAFAMNCSPENRHLVAGRPGRAADELHQRRRLDRRALRARRGAGRATRPGWNDPIIGLGLSITYRDVRIVSDLLLGSDDWATLSFAPYAEERAERMRRLRFAAGLQAAHRHGVRRGGRASAAAASSSARRPTPALKAHAFAVMAGPESLPPEIFTEAHRARVLGRERRRTRHERSSTSPTSTPRWLQAWTDKDVRRALRLLCRGLRLHGPADRRRASRATRRCAPISPASSPPRRR